MATWKLSNFSRSVLEDGCTNIETTITIPAEDAVLMPALGVDEQFPLTIWDGQNDPEIVYVTDNPGTGILTVLRGQESSNQQAWPAGSEVRLAITAAVYEEAITQAFENAADLAAALAGFDDLTYEIATYVDNHTLDITDKGKVILMNKATAVNLTIPLNATVAFPISTRIDLVQFGTGQVTVVATGGVTLNSAGGDTKTFEQYSGASLLKTGTNEWLLAGNITT